MGRTAPLTSKRCILYIYSTNISTKYFKRALYSPFFSLQNAVCFIMLTRLVPVLFIFYIQDVLKLKKKNNSGAKGLRISCLRYTSSPPLTRPADCSMTCCNSSLAHDIFWWTVAFSATVATRSQRAWYLVTSDAKSVDPTTTSPALSIMAIEVSCYVNGLEEGCTRRCLYQRWG